VSSGAVARAETEGVPATTLDASDGEKPGVVDTTPDSERKQGSPLGGEVAVGGALQNAAVAASLGLRYRLDRAWLVGLDAEYNPWISFAGSTVHSGATNFYATGIFRIPLSYQRINLRTTLQLGVSRTNFDLVGVPRGTVGPYIGFNVLGLDLELCESTYLILNPAHISVPVPQVSGVPFAYPQYRVTLGLQFGA
jgi:hypothetical protein